LLFLHRCRTWLKAVRVYTQRPVYLMLALGFSAGLPYLLIFSTLSAWLREEGISRTAIGFFAWVGITFSLKVVWAPLIDRIPLPVFTRLLGKRRSWLLLAQITITLGLLVMSLLTPTENLLYFVLIAFGVAFASATQDIVIDALRIEISSDELQGATAAAYIFGYRLALLFAGAGAFFFAEFYGWTVAYQIMALAMCVGIVATWYTVEPNANGFDVCKGLKMLSAPWWYQLIFAPFLEFFTRLGWASLGILLFVGFFRLSDIVMGIMANPFYLDLGFSKLEIASVGKFYGFAMTIIGSFIGGVFVAHVGVYRSLIWGACGVALTNVLFAFLATQGANLHWLIVTISADNLCGGFAGVVFIAYLSGLTNRAYTATQYALFSSLMTLPGKVVSGFSGMVVDHSSYAVFFVYAAVMGTPAILLSIWIWRRSLIHGDDAPC